MSHEQVACLLLLQLGVLIKHSLVEFAWCFRTTIVMSRSGWSRGGCWAVMWITSDTIRVLFPSSSSLSLPSPACCSRAVASSTPSTGSTSAQLDVRHELNSRVILSGISKGTYTLLLISKGLQVYFLGTGWRTPQPWSTIYDVGCCAF